MTREEGRQKKLFKKLADYNPQDNTTRFVNVNEFQGDYSDLKFGNGRSWCRNDSWRNDKLIAVRENGTITYSWHADDIERSRWENEVKDYRESNNINYKKGTSIQLIKLVGPIDHNTNRPIRKDIKLYYKKIPCVVCGTKTNLECDHKNDLYNDPRVLDTTTQKLEDFQSLCKHCNDKKRQVAKETRQTGRRYGATNIPSLSIYNIDFVEGDETYDPTDINAMVGTYWYDPIAFMSKIKEILLQTK